jgi:hypothetical protein
VLNPDTTFSRNAYTLFGFRLNGATTRRRLPLDAVKFTTAADSCDAASAPRYAALPLPANSCDHWITYDGDHDDDYEPDVFRAVVLQADGGTSVPSMTVY